VDHITVQGDTVVQDLANFICKLIAFFYCAHLVSPLVR
jgi:hypothetical protein